MDSARLAAAARRADVGEDSPAPSTHAGERVLREALSRSATTVVVALPLPMTPDEIASRLEKTLSGRTDVRLAVLFGSQARGTARADSDVDVAVDAPGVDCAALSVELGDALGREVDVVPLQAESIPLLHAIVRDGIVVHEARRGAGGLWRSHTLATLEIDLPWFRRMADAMLVRLAAGVGDPEASPDG